jgi:hypothetical protein
MLGTEMLDQRPTHNVEAGMARYPGANSMSEARSTDERTQNVKVSGTGWLCALHEDEWLAILKLTDEQVREWNEYLNAMVKS